MNNLDDKLILKILNYVDIYDLIINCKLINKKFLKLINQIEFDELILLNQTTFNINNWFYNYDPINTRNLLIIKSDFLKLKLFKKQFKKIKSLKIDYPIVSRNFSLEQLNCLNNLKQLEISFVESLSKDVNLKLKKLEILSINHDVKLKFKFIINSNELKILKIDNLQFISIKNPLKIVHLELYQFHENVNQFKNLRILRISKITRSLIDLELSSLKELTQLSLYGSNLISDKIQNDSINFLYNDNLKRTYMNDLLGIRKVKEIINQLNRNIKIHKRENFLKFYLKGVCVNRKENFDNDSFSIFDQQDYVLHKEFSNKKLEKRFHWLIEIDYKQFTNIYQMKIDFKRYFNIQIVNLIGGLDESGSSNFLKFLSNCRNLSALTLYYTSFNYEIYNCLPLITKSITQLVIFENDNIEIDYNFILEFKLLTNFYTNQQLDQELVNEMLKNLKLINNLRYEFDDDIILITQNSLGQFSTLKDKNHLKISSENNLNTIKFLDDSSNSQINLDSVDISSDIEIQNIDNIKFLDSQNNSIKDGNSLIEDKSIKEKDNSFEEEECKSFNSIIEQFSSQINNQIINTSSYTDSSNGISISTNSDSKYDSADDNDLKYNSISEFKIDKNLKIYTNEEDLCINSINDLQLADNKEENNNKNEEDDNQNKEDNSKCEEDNSKYDDNEYKVTVI